MPPPWADIPTLKMKPGNNTDSKTFNSVVVRGPRQFSINHLNQFCARKLKSVLERGRASQVDFSSYMAMSYDNPWKILNRRNDVMYKKL